MICKEEVYKWFKKLNGSARIEVLCCLLNMLFPLEVRFLGCCVENLGNGNYDFLKLAERNANDIKHVSALTDMKDENCRCQIAIVLSLLHSCSRLCANFIFRILNEVNLQEFVSLLDEEGIKVTMLLYTMAMYHPAFTFDQQFILRKHLNTLREFASDCMPKVNHNKEFPSPPPISLPVSHKISPVPPSSLSSVNSGVTSHVSSHFQMLARTRMNVSSHHALISSLELVDVCKVACRIRVTWAAGEQVEVLKTHQEIQSFHNRLLQLFPPEAKAVCPDKYIPQFPGFTTFKKNEDINEDLAAKMGNYFRQLIMHLPLHLLNSDFVVKFFQPVVKTKQNINNSALEDVKLHSFMLYNSNVSDSSGIKLDTSQDLPSSELICINKSISDTDARLKNDAMCDTLTAISSTSSSPSPPDTLSSESNSRSESPGNQELTMWLEKSNNKTFPVENQIKYSDSQHEDILQNYSIKDCHEVEDLRRLDSTHRCIDMLNNSFDNVKLGVPPNGLTKHSFNTCGKNRIPRYEDGISVKEDNCMHCNGEDSPCNPIASPPDSSQVSGEFLKYSVTNGSTNQKLVENKHLDGKENVPLLDMTVAKDKLPVLNSTKGEESCISIPSITASTNTTIPSNHQQSLRPNSLPINKSVNHNIQQSVLPSRVSSVGVNSHLLNNIAINNCIPDVTNYCTMPHISCSTKDMITSTSIAATFGNSKISPEDGLYLNSPMYETISRSHHQVPEGITTCYNSYVSPIIHASHPHCTSASSCATVNSLAISSFVPTTNVTQTTWNYGYIPHIFQSPLSFHHPQTASQHNGLISQIPVPSPPSNFMFAVQNIVPDLSYTNFHIPSHAPAPPPSAPHGSPSTPTGLAAFQGNCNYVQETLPSSSIHLKPKTCFNCGGVGHRGADCKEFTQEDIIASQYLLKYIPVPRLVEIHN